MQPLRAGVLALALLPALAFSVRAQVVQPNNYGEIGLIQTPTARLGEDGDFRIGVSSSFPYDQLLFSATMLPFVEATFRYSRIVNRFYGPQSFSGTQSLKDRGVDLKLRLLEEGPVWPQLALGLRDVGGTGIYGGEYLVASRRIYDFDVSLGLGWGRLGSGGKLGNPLSFISDSFDQRERNTGFGGKPSLTSFFRGSEVALFGGVTWQTPIRNLRLLLEFDGNDYQAESQLNNQSVHFPVNVGLTYRVWDFLTLGGGIERGDTFSFRLLATTNFHENRGLPKFNDPPPSSKTTAQSEVNPDYIERIKADLKRQGVVLQALDENPERRTLSAWSSGSHFRDPAKALGRSLRVLALHAPKHFGYFNLTEVSAGAGVFTASFYRQDAEKLFADQISAEEAQWRAQLAPPLELPQSAEFINEEAYPGFDWGMGPQLRQHVGGPEGFYFFQVWWRVTGNLSLTPHWHASSAIGLNVYNNFDGLTQPSDSVLPHVRSDIVQYLREGRNNLVRLETDYIDSFATDWYGRVSAGIFEEMYAGVAAETLYRPFGQRWALGLNVNRVRQRDFDQRLRFRDYQVTTGHLTGYFKWPTPDILVKISAGQYLAGDRGVTVDASRLFRSGVRVGSFATKTNVSAEQFGEGSFDKGFYVSLPVDLFFTRSSRRYAFFGFRPLTRDGGQKVRDGRELYGLFETFGTDPANYNWGRLAD